MDTNEDGVALTSVAHPQPSPLQRLRWLFKSRKISPSAFEEVEIEPTKCGATKLFLVNPQPGDLEATLKLMNAQVKK